MSRVRSPVVLWNELTPCEAQPSKFKYRTVGPEWRGNSWATPVMSVMDMSWRSSSASNCGRARRRIRVELWEADFMEGSSVPTGTVTRVTMISL